MLDTLRVRDIMAAMIGEVRSGLFGTMDWLGLEPMSDPAWYRTLIGLYQPQTPADRSRTRVLGQVAGKLKGGQIEAVSILDPVLLHPHVLARTTSGAEARKLILAVAYVRSRYGSAGALVVDGALDLC